MTDRRPLTTTEIADAAMTAALVMALQTIGRLLAAGTFFQVFSTLTMSVLAARHRGRVVASATVAAGGMTILLGGIGPISHAVIAGLMGWANGVAIRRRYGLIRHVARALVIAWPIISLASIGILLVLADFRELTLDNARNNWTGIARILDWIGIPTGTVTDAVEWTITNWWIFIPIVQAGITVGYALIVRRLGRAVIRRVDAALGEPPDHQITRPVEPPCPLPLQLGDVAVTRGANVVRVGDLHTRIEPGDRVALVGPNGAGKTSLLDAIAGIAPATGVEPSGPRGLGRAGGIAVVSQQPISQVLGVRVIDDIRWGAPTDADPTALLETIGLADQRLQPTSELSGGELQRLAVGAALLRQPALLLSDESTAMLDPDGRRAIMGLLHAAAADGAAVLHSTHLADDLATFDRRLPIGPQTSAAALGWISSPRASEPLLEARDLGFVHHPGSPWEARALAHVDLAVGRGQLLVIKGSNGSGKTTLARTLSGLLTPTEGTVLLEGVPVVKPSRRIAIAFQHARLQLLRSRLGDEVAALAGTHDTGEALRTVGFDPERDSERRVDELSGGEARRALLAGIVARAADVVILDEPLAGLDEPGRHVLGGIVDHLLLRGTAVVVVSHDPAWALSRADQILDLDVVNQVGAPV